MEHEVKVLRKLLNHKIFLDQVPGIREVDVREYGKSIDVVFFFDERFSYDEYRLIKADAFRAVFELAKMAGINSLNLNVHPR